MDPKPPKAVAKCNVVAEVLDTLRDILQRSYVKLLDIESSPEHPLPRTFVDTLLNEGRTSGVIRRLKLNVHLLMFCKSIQKLPLISGRILEIDLCRSGELTPTTISDSFLQHAISSGVLRLRASYVKDTNDEISRLRWSGLDGPSRFREETIFNFCFAKRDKRHVDDGRRELWLNGLSFKPGFLRRFIEALFELDSESLKESEIGVFLERYGIVSESVRDPGPNSTTDSTACNALDHVVDIKAYFHGDVCYQDISDLPWRWDDDTELGVLVSGDVPLSVRVRRSDNLILIHRGPFQESVFESKRSGAHCKSLVFIDLPVELDLDMHCSN